MVITLASDRPREQVPGRPGERHARFEHDFMRTSGIRFLVWALVLAAASLQATAAPAGQAAGQPPAVQQPPATPQAPAAQQPPKPLADGRVLWCGREIGPPSQLPPAGSGPVIYQIGLCFPEQGNASVIEAETYLFYIKTKTSDSKSGNWTRWDDVQTPESLRQDFKELWGMKFLDNLSIEVTDYPFSNGVIGKMIAYNMEERQRVKIVDYVGAKHLERSKIDEKLKEENATVRLDSFVDPGMVRKVKKVVLDMLAEKGYQFATVTPDIKTLPGGPKLINLTFVIDEGPQVKIRDVVFSGNKDVSSSALKRQMKSNKGRGMFSWITGSSSYQEGKFEEDADRVVGYYRDKGYYTARIGDPSFRYLEDSADRKTRWVELRIDVTEGLRYRVASLTFEGNKIVRAEGLRPLFKVRDGDYYSDKVIKKGYEKARELYGSAGYYQFNLVPMVKPHEERPASEGAAAAGAKPAEAAAPPAGARPEAAKPDAAKPDAAKPEAAKAGAGAKAPPPIPPGPGEAQPPIPPGPGQAQKSKAVPPKPRILGPSVDVTLQLDEGKQYFINRIRFAGNTTTRDSVVRRELRLYEEGVFNTEALKFSIKRVNQLAYFKQLEGGKDVDVKETPGTDNKMDVTLKFEEQNRNQLQFGAGVSQYRGVLRDARLPDRELPGPRRDVQRQPPGRIARAELRGGLHRAVPVRSPDHRRRRRLQAPPRVRRAVHAGLDRREHHVRVPVEGTDPDVLQLLVRAHEGPRPESGVLEPGADRQQPVPGVLPAARRRRRADDQQDRPEHQPQHGG